MIGIYKITNKINGKIYIGQSNDIKRRFFEVTVPTYSDNVVINKSCLSSSQLFGAYAYAKKYIGY